MRLSDRFSFSTTTTETIFQHLHLNPEPNRWNSTHVINQLIIDRATLTQPSSLQNGKCFPLSFQDTFHSFHIEFKMSDGIVVDLSSAVQWPRFADAFRKCAPIVFVFSIGFDYIRVDLFICANLVCAPNKFSAEGSSNSSMCSILFIRFFLARIRSVSRGWRTAPFICTRDISSLHNNNLRTIGMCKSRQWNMQLFDLAMRGSELDLHNSNTAFNISFKI